MGKASVCVWGVGGGLHYFKFWAFIFSYFLKKKVEKELENY